MKLCFNLHAIFDPDSDFTALRCSVHTYSGSTYLERPTVLFERDLDVVWGDRHSIQVRNAMEKALEAFTSTERALRGLPR